MVEPLAGSVAESGQDWEAIQFLFLISAFYYRKVKQQDLCALWKV